MTRFKQHIIFGLLAITGCVAGLTGCTKLDIDPVSSLTPANFPKTEAQFVAATGPIYTAWRGGIARTYWIIANIAADENVMVARGGNWYDGGVYSQINLHTYDQDNGNVQAAWTWGFSTISTCNQVLSLFSTVAESATKTQTVSEIKTMRAMAYFYMMDLYGNIPISTTFGDTSNLATQPRAQVFSFIETELLEAVPNLSSTVDASTYGRPTKYLAYALLAKLYINASYYTGTDRNADAVKMCDNIITAGKYALDEDYLGMFKPNNGPQIKDFIYAVPFDSKQATGQTDARFTLHPALREKFSMPYTPAGPIYTFPGYYALYTDPNDTRSKQYLTGKQFKFDGTPIMISTTNKGLDDNYTGSDPTGVIQHQLEFTPNIIWRNNATFDIGNDELANEQGYRNNKFYPDSTSTDRNQSNDVPQFRYADILLTKAEAILRGAAATNGETALTLVNTVRARANAAALPSVTLSTILDERGRELAMEMWRRNDLIRFGQFEKTWGIKTNADPQRRIFPIPKGEIQLNPKLVQNPGY
jgi:hypothetical protein